MPADRDAAREAIEAAVAAIPPGEVLSYGGVARRAGLPGRARLVGRVLRESARDLPWHRVLRADGRPAFPAGTAACEEQLARLRAEGVALRGSRLAVPPSAADDLDALLWGPQSGRPPA